MTKQSFDDWMKKLEGPKLDIWREAMTQLRQTHMDIWNGVRFYTTINGAIVAAIFAIFGQANDLSQADGRIVALAAIGLLLTIVALRILYRHKDYYVRMFLQKTLLEKEIGLYEPILPGEVNLSFPWHVEPKFLENLSDTAKWSKEQRFRGEISSLIRYTY